MRIKANEAREDYQIFMQAVRDGDYNLVEHMLKEDKLLALQIDRV
jgi:hypothetical protein